MSSELVSVLLGACIASVVPIYTLILSNERWTKEKRIEHLRIKHDKLETIYSEIISGLPNAIVNNLYPSSITTKISVYGSPEIIRLWDDFMKDKDKDEFKKKCFIFDMSKEANKHLLSIEKKIENVLS